MLGRNGAGKTTTIRMILDLIKPDSGQILWNNRPFQRKTYLLAIYQKSVDYTRK